jgi:uncharacterized protein YjbI with pentapeptide repeats
MVPAWAFFAVSFLSLAVGVVVGSVVWSSAGSVAGPDRASVQADAVRSAIAAGVGVAGLFALWIQTRKQRTEEKRHTLEEARLEIEQLSREEQMVVDLYVRGVTHLGDENPAVQIGGVYALARIADTAPAERQRIVNTLCAILRNPVDGPEDELPASVRRVRTTILEVLQDRLDPESSFHWSGIELDLSGARLESLDLIGISLRSARFDDCVVRKEFRLINCAAEDSIAFGRSHFHGPFVIGGVRSAGRMWFDDVEFGDHFHAEVADLRQGLNMVSCIFGRKASFDDAVFAGRVDVRKCRFNGGLAMERSLFEDNVLFYDVSARADMSFASAVFRQHARFTECDFAADVQFSEASSEAGLDFDVVSFESLNMSGAHLGNLNFSSCYADRESVLLPDEYELISTEDEPLLARPRG